MESSTAKRWTAPPGSVLAGAAGGKAVEMRSPLHVLIVEDDANDQFILARLLKHSKYFECQIALADDMETARLYLQATNYDLILLDFWVGAENSLRIACDEALRSGGAAVIVVSSLDMTDVQEKSLDAGAMAFLAKSDLSSSALDATLRTLMHHRARESQLSKSLAEKAREEIRLKDTAAEMAHELMNTLNAVHDMADVISTKQAAQISKQMRESYPGLIREGSQQLISMLQHYLVQMESHHILQQLTYQECCIIDIVDSAIKAMLLKCRIKSQDIDLLTTSDQLPVEVDPRAIYQLLINLISNASKYSPDGAPIRITLEDVGEDVHLVVIDQGIGMSQDEVALVQQRYMRVQPLEKPEIEGFGLGLSVVRSIVDMHGGKMRIESFKDWGTSVFIELPRRRPTVN